MKNRGLLTLILYVSATLGLLSSYEISIISGVLVFLRSQFTMTTAVQSQIVSVLILGAMGAIILAGPILDRFGRKKGLFIAGVFYIIGSFLSVFADSISQIITARILSGIGVGVASITIPLYLAEISTPKIRGAVVSFYQLSVTIGILLSYLVNFYFSGTENWRGSFFVGFLFSVAGFIGIFFIPESPHWLLLRKRVDEARRVLKILRPNEEVDKIVEGIVLGTKKTGKIAFSSFLKKGLLGPFIFAGLLACFQQITGINSVIYYAPTIFQKIGIETISASLLATIGIGAVNVFATIFAVLWVDRFGRRKLLLIGLLGMALSLFAFIGFYGSQALSVLFLLSYVVFFAISLGPITMLLISEIFPLQIRGKAVSYGFFMIWFFNYVVTSSFLGVVDALTIRGAYGLFAVFSCLGLFFVYFFAPETKGKTLEEVQQFWKK